jgi:hypothetical protein
MKMERATAQQAEGHRGKTEHLEDGNWAHLITTTNEEIGALAQEVAALNPEPAEADFFHK